MYNVWSHSYRVLQKRVGGSVECGGCAAQCASGWDNLYGEAAAVIILSRGAKGRISLGLCHYLMWSHTARPSPDMVLTLQLAVSRTFKLVLQTINRRSCTITEEAPTKGLLLVESALSHFHY